MIGDCLSISIHSGGRGRRPAHMMRVEASSLVDRLEVDNASSRIRLWGLYLGLAEALIGGGG